MSYITKYIIFIFYLNYSMCFLTSFHNKTRLKHLSIVNNGKVAEYYDWRDYGAVSPIKNQKDCASCWAFGIAAHLESQFKLHYNQTFIISEQFLIDCLNTSTGCWPGNVLISLGEITSALGGVLREEYYYPYASSDKLPCRWDGRSNLVPVTGVKRVYPREDHMIKALLTHGPLISAINSKSMDVYKNGIDEPTDEKCDPRALDHVVLIVGYNSYVNTKTNQVVPYWIIKNSWGKEWGDDGFYYLVRGRNACGVESEVAIAYVY